MPPSPPVLRFLPAALVLLSACTESGQVLGPEGATSARVEVSTGPDHTCAVSDGRLACWGRNDAGQLGSGDTSNQLRPNWAQTESAFQDVVAADRHTCALSTTAEVYCFGENTNGQLGIGSRTASSVPVRVALPVPASLISCRFRHCCALGADGSLHCWGQNDEGQLGQGDSFEGSSDVLDPVVVPGDDFRSVDTGQGHTCAIRGVGTLWCWGRNSENELGPDPNIQVRRPIQVGTENDWLEVDAGQHHTCARKQNGSIWCWGQNTASDTDEGFPLGVPGARLAEPTLLVSARAWSALDSDTFHSCALGPMNDLWCWGRNVEGQLGTGDLVLRQSPESIGLGYTRVDVGRFTTCAVRADASIACAGENRFGQLGMGDTARRSEFSVVNW